MNFTYNDKNYLVIITYKNNKNLYIKVDDDFNIRINSPYLYPKLLIKKIIKENYKSITKMIEEKERKRNLNRNINKLFGKKINVIYSDVTTPQYNCYNLIVKDDVMLNNWYKTMALKSFKEELYSIYEKFDEKIPYPKLKIRKMKTRWGVCNKKDNSITLNLDLVKEDKIYLDYVIVHELSHFIHFDHSKSFWLLVGKYTPNYKEIRKEMRSW